MTMPINMFNEIIETRNAMTTTNTDEQELIELIEDIFFDGYDGYLHEKIDKLLPLIEAQKQRWQIEARIEESKLWYEEWGYGREKIGDGSWEDYYAHRTANLKSLLPSSDNQVKEKV